MLVTKELTVAIDFYSIEKNTMEVNGYRQMFGYQHSSKYLLLCLREKRFGTTWWCVNDDKMFIFGWTITLMQAYEADYKVTI